jgi:hypothetical protein
MSEIVTFFEVIHKQNGRACPLPKNTESAGIAGGAGCAFHANPSAFDSQYAANSADVIAGMMYLSCPVNRAKSFTAGLSFAKYRM